MPMNVLFIESDQQRWDALGIHSDGLVQTPNLDRLAARGVDFANFYSNSPLCCPSRASAYTGRWCHEIGCYGNSTPFDGRVPTYGNILSDHGMTPHSFGSLDLAPGCEHGFDAVRAGGRGDDDPGEFMRAPLSQRVGLYRDIVWTTKILQRDDEGRMQSSGQVCDRIRQCAKKDEPWHVHWTNTLPHPPFYVPGRFVEMYDGDRTPLPPLPDGHLEGIHEAVKQQRYHWRTLERFPDLTVRYNRTLYYAMTTWMDWMVGQVLDLLAELGLENETLIVFTSDHGESLGDHGMWSKGSFYEGSAHVPCLMAGPGIPVGSTVTAPASRIDLAPTILEAHGIDVPDAMRGRSLLGVARGDRSDHPGIALGTYHGHDAMTGQYMVRKGDYKYIHHVGLPPQLFDLANDPDELDDLGQADTHTDVRAELEADLRREFDPESVHTEAMRFQRERFRAWLDRDPERAEEILKPYLGEEQYRDLQAGSPDRVRPVPAAAQVVPSWIDWLPR